MARPILSPNQEQAIQLLKKDGVPENAARVVVKALPKHMSAGKIRILDHIRNVLNVAARSSYI